jgi:hypothetical protein
VSEPLRLSFEVACRPDHAFRVWTADIGTWWPADHTVSGEAGLDVVLEGRLGGRLYERTAAGEEHDWGEVTVWQPPSVLGYRWWLRADRADATDVTVRFTAAGERSTRIDVEHAGWERLGARGPAWRERNLGGWTTLLPHYRAAVTPA